MKLYDENENYVGEIERPEPIKCGEKWWEFVEYRVARNGEHYLFEDQTGIGHATEDHRRIYLHWIASKIPRATPEQLKAIGMRESDGSPAECKEGDVVWGGLSACKLEKHSSNAHLIGHYRFVLVPDVQKEIHTSCEGCDDGEKPCVNVGELCFGCYGTSDHPNWHSKVIKQPSQPDEPRFSLEQIKIIQEWILGNLLFNGFHEDPIDQKDYNAAIRHLAKYIFDKEDGLMASRKGGGDE